MKFDPFLMVNPLVGILVLLVVMADIVRAQETGSCCFQSALTIEEMDDFCGPDLLCAPNFCSGVDHCCAAPCGDGLPDCGIGQTCTIAGYCSFEGSTDLCFGEGLPGSQLPTLSELFADQTDLNILRQALTDEGIAFFEDFPGITLFAPTDSAFTNTLGPDALTNFATPPYQIHLEYFLASHVLGYAAWALVDDLTIGTLVDTSLNVSQVEDSTYIETEVSRALVVEELRFSNGFMYKVDSVLIPFLLNATIWDVIVLSSDHTILRDALIATGLDEMLSNGTLITTLIAPPDAAFDPAFDPQSTDPNTLREILLYHMLPDLQITRLFNDGQAIGTVQGDDVLVRLHEDEEVFFNGLLVVLPNLPVANGIVHYLDSDGILLPTALQQGRCCFNAFLPSEELDDFCGPVMSCAANFCGGEDHCCAIPCGEGLPDCPGFDQSCSGGFCTFLGSDTNQCVGEGPSFDPPLSEVITGDGELSILKSALGAEGLAGLDSLEAVTLFAPTDAAFAALGEENLANFAKPEYQAHVSFILRYHVLTYEVPSINMFDEQLLFPVLGGNTLTVDIPEDDPSLLVIRTEIGQAQVIDKDVIFENGVMHKLDAVLIPGVLAVTIWDWLQLSPDHTTLVKALELTGLDTALGDTETRTTLLAPTDEAFQVAFPDGLDPVFEDIPRLTEILMYHVVSGLKISSILEDGDEILTAEGSSVVIKLVEAPDDDDETTVLVNGIEVSVGDIPFNNGVLHFLTNVLIPPAPAPTMTPEDPTPAPTPAPIPAASLQPTPDATAETSLSIQPDTSEPTSTPSASVRVFSCALVSFTVLGSILSSLIN